MATLAIEPVAQRRFFIRLNSAVADPNNGFSIALDGLVLRAGADLAIVYRFDNRRGKLNAVARCSHPPTEIGDVRANLSCVTTRWLEDLAGPAQGNPSSDVRFEGLPEVIHHKLNRLLVVPLQGAEGLLGILTLGRLPDSEFNEAAIRIAEQSARLLAAAMERDSLQKKLVDRKLVERAKGILQKRWQLSEELTYLKFREISQRRRKSMAELAKEIIDAHLPRSPVSDTESRMTFIGRFPTTSKPANDDQCETVQRMDGTGNLSLAKSSRQVPART
jgi:GAF domain-containing protein